MTTKLEAAVHYKQMQEAESLAFERGFISALVPDDTAKGWALTVWHAGVLQLTVHMSKGGYSVAYTHGPDGTTTSVRTCGPVAAVDGLGMAPALAPRLTP